ncbi:hypothetical protein B0H14DRAFT_3143139 [Mycena olivaceomarginata]|nr:hypothetical protein B0H14DRAFT_3143139 [Mycena olivaceomarginata]
MLAMMVGDHHDFTDVFLDFAGATYRLPVTPRPLGFGALEEGGWTDMGAREKLGSENEPNDVRTYMFLACHVIGARGQSQMAAMTSTSRASLEGRDAPPIPDDCQQHTLRASQRLCNTVDSGSKKRRSLDSAVDEEEMRKRLKALLAPASFGERIQETGHYDTSVKTSENSTPLTRNHTFGGYTFSDIGYRLVTSLPFRSLVGLLTLTRYSRRSRPDGPNVQAPRWVLSGGTVAFVTSSARLNVVQEPALLRAKTTLEASGFRAKIFWTSEPKKVMEDGMKKRKCESRGKVIERNDIQSDPFLRLRARREL